MTGKKLSSILAHDHSVVSCSVDENANKYVLCYWHVHSIGA